MEGAVKLGMFTTDKQWDVLSPVLQRPKRSAFGRPRANEREVFEAILFMLHTGIPWKHLPPNFPPKSTVYDYLKNWNQSRAFRALLAIVIKQLLEAGRIDLEVCIADATFTAAKGRFYSGESTRGIEEGNIMLVVDEKYIKSRHFAGNEHVKRAEIGQQTANDERQYKKSGNCYDNAANDADPLDDILIELGIKVDDRNHQNQQVCTFAQAGRPLRRKRHRWVIEHTITWLRYHRRLLTR
jgi:transposase